MEKRFASIWFPYLTTDRHTIRKPALRKVPFALVAPVHGRIVITEANATAEAQGVRRGMTVADARAFLPALEVADERPGLAAGLLEVLGLWCIRYTPVVALDTPDGLLLDISGCAHLWGGEDRYLHDIMSRLQARGFHVRAAIAGTAGAARAAARFGREASVVPGGGEAAMLGGLPPEALRLEPAVVAKLRKLGLRTVGSFMHMPSSVLLRRFGPGLPLRLRQALGQEEEPVVPLRPVPPYMERLPCLEPISTAVGVEAAIQRLLEPLCKRLSGEGKGLRTARLTGYRVDGKVEQVAVATSRATANIPHLLKLFGLKIPLITPGLGIELFVLEASGVEEADPVQEALWGSASGLDNTALPELIDRLKGREGTRAVYRYLPDEHHWPERSFREAVSVTELPPTGWQSDRRRPTRLLPTPEPIEVTVPVPDYPPMLFRHRGKAHPVRRADGPERIEREWWMDPGEHRDYYCVEDDQGRRYWLFRAGHYGDDRPRQWFLHGFFA